MFAALYAAEGSDAGAVLDVGRAFSPRVEAHLPREVILDLDGLTRLFGDARTIGAEIRRTAADRKLQLRVAIAGSRTASRLLARHRAGLTLASDGDLIDAESDRIAVAEGPTSRLTIFGNLVMSLTSDGNAIAAIALERHWNTLTHGLPFVTLCGYAMSCFHDDVPTLWSDACAEHSVLSHASDV